jgi:demethylmenaquinone methyltransferase/2-methoxy-6-polyprenyl-1,4-benzoquinol methylase
MSKAKVGDSVLDCATGTGDLAIAFKKKVKNGNVIGTDFCDDMLKYAPDKANKKNLNIKFELADVMSLQYEENTFDIASISFGIRNVDNPSQGISEMARVVKKDGRVVVLEFGQPSGFFGAIYKWYSKNVIPLIGKMIAGSDFAYTYLPETAAKFPSGHAFVKLMENTGKFSEVHKKSLTFGIAYVYVGVVK